MTFRRIDPQSVESSEGFSLRSRHRYYYHYKEDDHVIRVDVEPRKDPTTHDYFEVVFEESLKSWQPPFDKEPIPEAKRERVKGNIAAALAFMRIPHRFE